MINLESEIDRVVQPENSQNTELLSLAHQIMRAGQMFPCDILVTVNDSWKNQFFASLENLDFGIS